MVGFKVLSAMKDSSLEDKVGSAYTGAIGDLIEQEAGSATWTACDSTTECYTRKAIVMEATVSSSLVLAYELDGTETVEAQCTNTADATHNGDKHTLTDENTVNNAGGGDITTSVVTFFQDRLGSPTTSLIGRVLVGNGVTLAA